MFAWLSSIICKQSKMSPLSDCRDSSMTASLTVHINIMMYVCTRTVDVYITETLHLLSVETCSEELLKNT